MAKKKAPKKNGRPKKKIDYEQVEKLARIHCTQEEIAAILEVSTRTLQRDKEFCRVYKKATDTGRASLRRLQWKKAMEGHTGMLVWLGKQILGQTEKSVTEASIPGGVDVRVTYADGGHKGK